MATRYIRPEDVGWTNGTYRTTGCNGPYIATDRGQDSLACCRCHNIRNLMYAGMAASVCSTGSRAFHKLVEMFPFVEFTHIACANLSIIVYPLRPLSGSDSMSRDRLKQVFLAWHDLKIANREINHTQVFSRVGYHPVVLPNANTTAYADYGDDDGVKLIQPSSPEGTKRLRVVNMDKVVASGRYMYLVNYMQTLQVLGILDRHTDKNAIYDRIEIF